MVAINYEIYRLSLPNDSYQHVNEFKLTSEDSIGDISIIPLGRGHSGKPVAVACRAFMV